MGLFNHRKGPPQPINTPEQAVIVTLQIGELLVEPETIERLFELEDHLTERVTDAGVGEVDGTLLGNGEAVLYCYGPDADALFEAIEDDLRALPYRPGICTLRYGAPSDPHTAERFVEL